MSECACVRPPLGGVSSPRWRLLFVRFACRYGNSLYAGGAWSGRLQWASTETGGESPGHIEGALCAGERVVRAIARMPADRGGGDGGGAGGK